MAAPAEGFDAPHPGWSPAFRLILALLRGDHPAAAALGRQVDAEAFGAALRRHRVAPALPAAAQLVVLLPAALIETLARRQRRVTFEALHRAGQLRVVIDALAGAGVRACAIKGPAFAALFGDALGREASDLDLLVTPADRDAAVACLETLGYRPLGLGTATLDRYCTTNHALTLRGDGGGPVIELHLRLGNQDRQFPMARFEPWCRLTQVTIAGAAVPTLEPVAAVVYAAFHGTKHNWHRLFWLVDLARVLAAPHFDWPAALALARHLGVERQLMMAVLLAEDLLGARCPPALAAETALRSIAGPLAQELAPHLDDLPSDRGTALAARLGAWSYARRQFALQSSWPMRFGLVSFFLAAGDEDRQFVTLPAWLGWAYPLVRGVRLLGRYRARRAP